MASKQLKPEWAQNRDERTLNVEYNNQLIDRYWKVFKRYLRLKSKGQIFTFAEYDGGDDSGYLSFIDDVQGSELFSDILLNQLEIYGFDGEPYQRGEIYYDPETNEIVKQGYERHMIEEYVKVSI